MFKRFFAVALTAATFLLTACSSGESTPETITVTETSASETSSTSVPDNMAEIGEEAASEGTTIVIDSIERTVAMEVCAPNYECGFRPHEIREAPEEGEFLILNSTISNNSKHPMDITCGFAIDTTVYNTDEQAYTGIGSLYEIPGNPGCNESLQAGFSDEMRWVYEIPRHTELAYFEFREVDPNMENFDIKPAFISLHGVEPEDPSGAASEQSQGNAAGPEPKAPDGSSSDAYEPPVEQPAVEVKQQEYLPEPEPVIGMTEAPDVAEPSPMNKVIQSCGDVSMHQTGTTFFTDGSTGWTQNCADQMMAG